MSEEGFVAIAAHLGFSEEGFVAIATRLEFLRRFRCNCCTSWFSEEGFAAIAIRLEFLRKVFVAIAIHRNFGFVAIASRLEFLWFRCNCYTS